MPDGNGQTEEMTSKLATMHPEPGRVSVSIVTRPGAPRNGDMAEGLLNSSPVAEEPLAASNRASWGGSCGLLRRMARHGRITALNYGAGRG